MKKYFACNEGEENHEGPFSFDEIKLKGINKDTLIWFEGLGNWEKAENIEEFKVLFINVPPPLPNKKTSSQHSDNSSKKNVESASFLKLDNTSNIIYLLAILIGIIICIIDVLDRNFNAMRIKEIWLFLIMGLFGGLLFVFGIIGIIAKYLKQEKHILIGLFCAILAVFLVTLYLKVRYPYPYIFGYILGSSVSSSNYIHQIATEINYIPTPPPIEYFITERKKFFIDEMFKDCNLTGDKKRLLKACNYDNITVRNYAVSLASKSAGNYNLGQICDVWDYCSKNWKYVNDPRAKEYVEYADNTIKNGLIGDCDDFAVLMCSLILAIGGEARINYAYNQSEGHAFTEVNIGYTAENIVDEYILARYKGKVSSKDNIWARKDERGNWWLNLDWFSNYPGGEYFKYDKGTSFYIIQNYCDNF